MGYLHIPNFIKAQEILLFKEAYAMEKIHGSSAHILWKDQKVHLFSGGESSVEFAKLFDVDKLDKGFLDSFGSQTVCVYGEVYGARCQGMKVTYGDKLRFIAFEVRIEDSWLSVPQAEEIVKSLGLEFVHYVKIQTTLDEIDKQRLSPSEQAFRNGCAGLDKPETWKKREGIVLRPLIEVTKNNGERIICKYKNEDFSERKSKVDTRTDPGRLKVLSNANAIAEEFITEMRLTHVLDSLGNPNDESSIPKIMATMIEDVEREGKGEIIESKEVKRAISARAIKLFKARLAAQRNKSLAENR